MAKKCIKQKLRHISKSETQFPLNGSQKYVLKISSIDIKENNNCPDEDFVKVESCRAHNLLSNATKYAMIR